jgi:hypothetical protein
MLRFAFISMTQEPEGLRHHKEPDMNSQKKEKVDVSKQTTHELLMHPHVLGAGCMLLQNLKANKMTATEVGKKMGLKKGRRLRSDRDDDSVDKSKIDEVVGKKKSKNKKTNLDPDPELENSLDNSNSVPANESIESLGESHEEGMAALRELIKRSAVSMSDDIDVDRKLS